MRNFLLVVVLALSASMAFAAPVYTIYTDQAAWLAATPGDHDPFGPPQNIGELAVISSVGSFGAPRGVFPAGTNVWTDRVTVAGGETTTFSDGDFYEDGQTVYYAFGGFWDFSPGGWGQGLTLALNNGLSFSICGNPAGCGAGMVVPDGTFFGVVTTPSFTTLTISADGQPGIAETFDLSHLDMVHSIPEPATMLLLGAGLLGLGLLKRSRA